jgi:hypothetical protein
MCTDFQICGIGYPPSSWFSFSRQAEAISKVGKNVNVTDGTDLRIRRIFQILGVGGTEAVRIKQAGKTFGVATLPKRHTMTGFPKANRKQGD